MPLACCRSREEHRKITRFRSELQTDPDGPDSLSFSGGFCPVNLSLFHGTRGTLLIIAASMTISFQGKGDSVCANRRGAIPEPTTATRGRATRGSTSTDCGHSGVTLSDRKPYPSVEIVLTTSWLQKLSTATAISYLPPARARWVVDTTRDVKARCNYIQSGADRTDIGKREFFRSTTCLLHMKGAC
jgi:hypothetical protein